MIFLDVGAHEGQTLKEVVDPRYGFTEIHAFEPMPKQFAVLAREYGGRSRVTLHNYGLASASGLRQVYGTNDAMEASMFSRKNDVDASVSTLCEFRSAAAVVASLGNASPRGGPSADLVVKLNCEGGEIEIIDDLIQNDKLGLIAAMLIDFDIKKVPGFGYLATDLIDELNHISFDRYALAEDVMVGETHQERIRSWLDGALSVR